jgi:hypothetical protein
MPKRSYHARLPPTPAQKERTRERARAYARANRGKIALANAKRRRVLMSYAIKGGYIPKHAHHRANLSRRAKAASLAPSYASVASRNPYNAPLPFLPGGEEMEVYRSSGNKRART